MWFHCALFAVCLAITLTPARAQTPLADVHRAEIKAIAEQAGLLDPGMNGMLEELEEVYRDLHQNPELSLREERTAALLAKRLLDAGFEVTESVGGLGVVGVLKNGDGPVVILRADMDGLPVKEETGLDFASEVTMTNDAGEAIPVMHACGHDMHMTTWLGAARVLVATRDHWRGTVVMVAQPAEEIVQGAVRMVADGLFTRFPKPDFVLGIHCSTTMAAGEIGIVPGPASAASDSVDIVFHGKGGHGATPHLTVDPVVMAARAVVALQTIVSREVDPFDSAVVTIGTFHAGTKRNVIPDTARIQLTVRSYKPAVQQKVLAAIRRIALAEAAAAGAPREPEVTVVEHESAEVVVNDPALAERLLQSMQVILSPEKVRLAEPVMTSEDFGVYGRASGAPSIQLRLGTVELRQFLEAKESGRLAELPGLHTARFAPAVQPTIRAGTAALVLATLELLETNPAAKGR